MDVVHAKRMFINLHRRAGINGQKVRPDCDATV
jgi:hypothetical protein